jgi:NADPH:quinone reductase-like Zn-dependent oxidoreductase
MHGMILSDIGIHAIFWRVPGGHHGDVKTTTQNVLGGPGVLTIAEVPLPEPGPSQLLVRVKAAGLNPTDWKHRSGKLFLPEPPFTLGWDVSGVVEKTGFGVTLFKPGDEVFGMLPYPGGHGSHAEYVTGPARAFARKPTNLDHIQAGAVPLAALTAWQALVDAASIQPGQRVLIHAAAGGVGHLAVQIAKARGAYVIGTASTGNHELVTSLGADEMIDYRTTDFAEAVKDIDVVLDPVGGDYTARSFRVLHPGGLVITIAGLAQQEVPDGVRHERLLVEADHAGMDAIRQLVEEGSLRPVIAGTFPLTEVAKAHATGETGHVAGKLVLTMD